MQFAVLGEVTQAEALGLGESNEKACRDQTGTLMTGTDIVVDDRNSFAAWLKGVFVPRSGGLARNLPVWCCLICFSSVCVRLAQLALLQTKDMK